jgi:hypothetical protein
MEFACTKSKYLHTINQTTPSGEEFSERSCLDNLFWFLCDEMALLSYWRSFRKIVTSCAEEHLIALSSTRGESNWREPSVLVGWLRFPEKLLLAPPFNTTMHRSAVDIAANAAEHAHKVTTHDTKINAVRYGKDVNMLPIVENTEIPLTSLHNPNSIALSARRTSWRWRRASHKRQNRTNRRWFHVIPLLIAKCYEVGLFTETNYGELWGIVTCDLNRKTSRQRLHCQSVHDALLKLIVLDLIMLWINLDRFSYCVYEVASHYLFECMCTSPINGYGMCPRQMILEIGCLLNCMFRRVHIMARSR